MALPKATAAQTDRRPSYALQRFVRRISDAAPNCLANLLNPNQFFQLTGGWLPNAAPWPAGWQSGYQSFHGSATNAGPLAGEQQINAACRLVPPIPTGGQNLWAGIPQLLRADDHSPVPRTKSFERRPPATGPPGDGIR